MEQADQRLSSYQKIVRPIWKLRQEAQDLQDNIIKLQGPMDKLQPAFNSLEKKMQGVESGMGGMLNELKSMNESLLQDEQSFPAVFGISPSVLHRSLTAASFTSCCIACGIA